MKQFAGLAVLILLASYFNPFFKMFYTFQYEKNGMYTMGYKDLYIVAYLVNLWLMVRSLFLNINFNMGKKEQRFREQFYQSFIYISTFSFGVYNYLESDFRYDWTATIKNYPHKYVSFDVKLYFMVILSMWIHMVFSLFWEKKRKDHIMMLSHHFVTITLVSISWFTHLTKIGLLIEMIFDSTDILLCVAKCVKYAKYEGLANMIFGVFVINWMFTRQYLFADIIMIFTQLKDYNDLEWDPANDKYVPKSLYYSIVVLLSSLYILSLMWFYTIIKLVVKMLNGSNVDDSRSDDEDDDTGKKNK